MRPSRTARPALAGLICVGLLIAGGLLLLGCAAQPGPSPASSTLRVVTTTTVFADLVGQVGGSRVSVTSLVPPGLGPEDYEPGVEDAKKLTAAQLVVSNGVGLDDFLEPLITTTASEAARLVLGEGIPAIETGGEPNPHFWLDPGLVVAYYLPAIETRLAELDPAGRSAYESHASAFARQLEALDEDLQALADQVPADRRKLVTFHDAFPYFARHYGFELVGVIVGNVGQDPSAGELARLVEAVRAAGATAVFSEAQFSPKLAETLAEEAGIQKVVTTLYNDALGDPPADSYTGMMRWNVEQVVEALR